MLKRLITRRPLGVKIAVAALILLAITSISGGRILLDDPSGKSMGIDFILSYLPLGLHNFFIVGIWLVTIFGMLPVILAAGLWFRKRWALWTSIGLGAAVVTWMLAEIYMFYSFGFVFFYPLIGGIGALTIMMLALPSSRQYFGRKSVINRSNR